MTSLCCEPQTYLTRCLQLLIRGQLSTLKFAKLLGLFIRQLVSPFARLPMVDTSCLLCRKKKEKKEWKKKGASLAERSSGKATDNYSEPERRNFGQATAFEWIRWLKLNRKTTEWLSSLLAVHQQLAHLLPAWFSCEGVLCWGCLDLTHA